MGLWPNSREVIGGAWNNIVAAIGAPPAGSDAVITIVGRASVSDGDTVDIRDTRIRLNGIDAPESRQSCRDRLGAQYPCGRRAAFALSDKIADQNLHCEVLDQDRYGRLVATCTLSNIDLNGWMVASGWALAYRQYSTAYVGAEEQARAAQAGIWSGEFTPPWEWRRSHDGESEVHPTPASGGISIEDGPGPSGCVIKGNISASGERIFHVPGQEHYARTVIRGVTGDRWFCSEAGEIAAGWRPAKR